MFSRMLSAALVMFVLGGFVLAETYRGLITSVSDKEVKMLVKKDKKDKTGEEKTFKVGKEVKVSVMKKKDKTDSSVSDITKAISDSKGGKGVVGSVTTTGEGDKEVVTEITYGGGKKK